MNGKHFGSVYLLVLPALLAACHGASGGAVGSPGLPPMGPAAAVQNLAGNAISSSARIATTHIVVRGSFHGRGPVFLVHRNRLKANAAPSAFAFTQLLVNGTVFPEDAAPYTIKNSITMPFPTNGDFSAAVPFSNVPVHRNELVLLDFNGVAKDGSSVDLGDLAGLINVPSASGKTPVLTVNTSLTAEVFAVLLANGELSTWDLDNTPNLGTEIHNAVAPLGITPDPTTKLYNAGQMRRIFNTVSLHFARTLTVNPGSEGSLWLDQDYTNAEELDVQANRALFGQLSGEAIPKIGNVLGAGSCGGFTVAAPAHAPPKNPVVASVVTTCVQLSAIGTATLANVYGGHLLIGASNNTFNFGVSSPPYAGGFVSLNGEPPGAKNLTVPTAPAQKILTVDDPVGFAFGSKIGTNFLFTVTPAFGTGPMSLTRFVGPSPFSRVSPATNYSKTNNTVTVETFNAFDIPVNHLQICGGMSCEPMGSTGTFKVMRAFYDYGNDLTYFNWKVGGTATAIAQNGTGGYDITTSGSGNATLTTTTPSAFLPGEFVVIESSIPGPSAWQVSAKDGAGNVYSNSAFGSDGLVQVQMASIPHIVRTKSITLTFTSPSSPGTYRLIGIFCGSNGGCP